MEDKLIQYLHQNCKRTLKIDFEQGILVVGKEILYTDHGVSRERMKYFDTNTDDKFDTFDELLEHVKKQLS